MSCIEYPLTPTRLTLEHLFRSESLEKSGPNAIERTPLKMMKPNEETLGPWQIHLQETPDSHGFLSFWDSSCSVKVHLHFTSEVFWSEGPQRQNVLVADGDGITLEGRWADPSESCWCVEFLRAFSNNSRRIRAWSHQGRSRVCRNPSHIQILTNYRDVSHASQHWYLIIMWVVWPSFSVFCQKTNRILKKWGRTLNRVFWVKECQGHLGVVWRRNKPLNSWILM